MKAPRNPVPMSGLARRIATATIGGGLLIGLTYAGGWAFGLAVLALGLAAQYEVYRLFERQGIAPWRIAGLVLGALLALRGFHDGMLAAAALWCLVLVVSVTFVNTGKVMQQLAATVLAAVYPTALLAFLTDIRLGEGPAFLLTLTVLLLIWATDTFAYASGKIAGRHPLAPAVSPSKTWEGFWGGILGALLVVTLLRFTLLGFLAWHHALALALLCSLATQAGDLAASRFKRDAQVKDYGSLLPGHGGLLDRFDGALAAAPVSYCYLVYVARALAV